MKRLSRRSFIGWLGALTTALGFRGQVAAASTMPDRRGRAGAPASPPALDQAMLAALAAAVLPSELGTVGAAAATRRFSQWLDGYVPGAEVLHPYGSGDLERLPQSPGPRWRKELAALDASARSAHGKGWASLGIGERQALVRAALRGAKLSGMPTPLAAPHVAVALLSHFYDSAEATDLCYRAQIRKNECRPLATSSRRPLPLAGGGTT